MFSAPFSVQQRSSLSCQFPEARVRTTMINALLFSFLAIIGNSFLAGASKNKNSVSVLQNPPAVLSLQLNSHAEIARTVSAATHLLKHDRRLQSFNFQVFCDIVEESGPFNCVCDCDTVSLIAVCDCSEVCSRDTCATFHVINTFDTTFSLLSVQTCVEYTQQVGDYLDGCVNVTLINNGQMFDTCDIAFVDDSGNLTECNECRVCDGRINFLAFDLNCSNIEVEASTSGCMVVEGETELLFPGFGDGSSAASNGLPRGLVWASSAVATLLLGLHRF